MEKIKLNLNALKVNSFKTAESKPIIGTVKGNATRYCQSDEPTCTIYNTYCCDPHEPWETENCPHTQGC